MTRPIPASEFAAAELAIDACWKRIGIEGDKSCAKLADHSHCRNCPIFSRAAAALLDRAMPGETWAELAGVSGLAIAPGEGETRSVMIFRLGAEWFGLPTLALDEIIGPRAIHSLPHRRNPGLLGLVNVRGELVICASLSQLLLGAAAGSTAEGRLIVTRHAGGRLALPVDEVMRTHHYSSGALRSLPATVARSPANFTAGLLALDDKMVAVLDENRLFDALDRGLT